MQKTTRENQTWNQQKVKKTRKKLTKNMLKNKKKKKKTGVQMLNICHDAMTRADCKESSRNNWLTDSQSMRSADDDNDNDNDGRHE